MTDLSDDDLGLVAEGFYNCLIRERTKLCDYLKTDIRYVYYHNLIRIMKYINEKYNKFGQDNLIGDLLMGKVGLECNKQSAIYEVPTLQLIVTVRAILGVFDFCTSVEEIMAGQGLFASLFEHYLKLDLKYNATDGMCVAETNANFGYFKVEKKNISEYLIEKIYSIDDKDKKFDKTLFLTIWPTLPTPTMNYVMEEFIKKVNPKIFVLVGQDDVYDSYFKLFENAKFSLIRLSPLQFSFKDYFHPLGSVVSHSNVSCFLHPDLGEFCDIGLVGEKIVAVAESFEKIGKLIFHNDRLLCDDKYVLQNFVNNHIVNSSLVADLDQAEREMLVKCLYNIKNTSKIPKYVKNIDEFNFWYKMEIVQTNKFPKNITGIQKFNEFKNFYEKLSSEAFLSIDGEMKDKNIYPFWVKNKEEAIKCLLLDYSTNDKNKSWKSSRSKMNSLYITVFDS